jgi:hypothetical protein
MPIPYPILPSEVKKIVLTPFLMQGWPTDNLPKLVQSLTTGHSDTAQAVNISSAAPGIAFIVMTLG